MINSDDFIKRLTSILEFYGLNAALFADKIGVQRSSVSHLMSGRNKPSLEFIMRLVSVFKDVDLEWIINGKGVFPKEEFIENTKPTSYQIPNQQPLKLNFSEETIQSSPANQDFKHALQNPVEQDVAAETENNNKIDKIVIFYSNGTFEAYHTK